MFTPTSFLAVWRWHSLELLVCPVLRAAASAARREKDPQGLRGGSAWLLDAEGTERGAELKLDRQAGTCDLALSLTGKASPSSSQPSVRTFDSGSPRAFFLGGRDWGFRAQFPGIPWRWLPVSFLSIFHTRRRS